MSEIAPSNEGVTRDGGGEAGLPNLLRPRAPMLAGVQSVVGVVIAVVIVLGIVWVWISPRTAPFRSTFFSGHFAIIAVKGSHASRLPSIVRAFWLNVWMALVSEAIVLVLALGVAALRITTSRALAPIRVLLVIYSDLARGIPMILFMLIVGLGVPGMGVHPISYYPEVAYGIFVLVFTYTAYVAEVMRAGLLAVPQSQVLAARSLGLKSHQAMRWVIVPQAIRYVLPALLNDFISLQKDTAIVSVVGIVEVVNAMQIQSNFYFNFTSFTVAAALFLVITVPLTRLCDRMIARDRSRRLAMAGR